MKILLFLLAFIGLLCLSYGCKCRLFEIDHYFCNSDYMIEAIVTSKQQTKEGEYLRQIWYGIEVQKVYKGNVSEALQEDPKIWTSGSSASCGRYFQLNDTYIITGGFKDNKLSTSSCSFGSALKYLSDDQKKFFADKKYETLQCSQNQ